VIFDTKLLNNGHLYCPKEFNNKKAKYKVIVIFQDDKNDFDEDIEMSAVKDCEDIDFLDDTELKYYLDLDTKK